MNFVFHYLSEAIDPKLSKRLDDFFSPYKVTKWEDARWILPSGMLSRGKHENQHNQTAMTWFDEYDTNENYVVKMITLGPIRMFVHKSTRGDRSYIYFHIGCKLSENQENTIRDIFKYGGTSYYYKLMIDLEKNEQPFDSKKYGQGDYEIEDVLDYIGNSYKQESPLYKSLATQYHEGSHIDEPHKLISENIDPTVKRLADAVAEILGIRFDGIWDVPQKKKDVEGIQDILQFTDVPIDSSKAEEQHTKTSLIFKLPKGGLNIKDMIVGVRDRVNQVRAKFGATLIPEI